MNLKDRIIKILLIIFLAVFVSFPASVASARPVIFVDFSFESVQIHNRIAGFILQHGYDREYGTVFLESFPGMLGLERGDIDVAMEGWVDNLHEWWAEAQEKETVYSAGKVFPDAPQGWYVPAYVIYGDESRGIEPVAPDLKSVSDLKKYWKLFEDSKEPGKARLYNGPSGWALSAINEQKIESYGLEDYVKSFDSGSQTGLSAAIASAYERGVPVLAYNWEPTAVIGKYDMVILEEPEYDEDVWDENYGCAYPAAEVLVLLNAEFAKNNPVLTEFFDRYQTTLEQMNKALAYMKDDKTDPDGAAVWFLREYPEVWSQWVGDDHIISKIKEALEDR